MISLTQARALALSTVQPAPAVRVPLLSAVGRFLAESISAPRSLPGCDNSAMDGYAVKSAETRGATRDQPATFKLVDLVFAGRLPTRYIGIGEAARIFTGAPIPAGVDAVVRQEAARTSGATVEVFTEVEPGTNIRQRGEEVMVSDALFAAGFKVNAYAAGVLASMGFDSARVRPRPRVAVLTMGDELVAPGKPALPHQVYDSNGILIAALAEEAGAEVVALARVKDEDSVLWNTLEKWFESTELIITTGGASVGDKDRVKRVIFAMGGDLLVDGVAIKPGKPAGLGVVGGRPIAVLPGNPGAAAVAFDQLARPMLLRRQGVEEQRPRIQARLDGRRRKQPALTYLLSARLMDGTDGIPWARIRPQGSGQIIQNVDAEGWVVLPSGRGEFEAGDEVEMELFSGAAYQPILGP